MSDDEQDDIEKVRAVCPECGSPTFEAFLLVGGAPASPILYCSACGNDGCVPADGDQGPDYLTPVDVPGRIVAEVAQEWGVMSGDVTRELWGHPGNEAHTDAQKAAVEARRRCRNSEADQ